MSENENRSVKQIDTQYREMFLNDKRAMVFDTIKSMFVYSFEMVLKDKIKINREKYTKVLIVSNLVNFESKWGKIKESKDFPSNLENEDLNILLTINNVVVVILW